MKERMQKTLAEVKGCPQKDRTESEGYVGAQTVMWICEGQHRGSTIRQGTPVGAHPQSRKSAQRLQGSSA